MKKRRTYSTKFKTQVVLKVLSKEKTITELSSEYEIHAMVITKWKREFLENAEKAFTERKKGEDEKDKLIDELYKQVGQSKVELDWLKKKAELFVCS